MLDGKKTLLSILIVLSCAITAHTALQFIVSVGTRIPLPNMVGLEVFLYAFILLALLAAFMFRDFMTLAETGSWGIIVGTLFFMLTIFANPVPEKERVVEELFFRGDLLRYFAFMCSPIALSLLSGYSLGVGLSWGMQIFAKLAKNRNRRR